MAAATSPAGTAPGAGDEVKSAATEPSGVIADICHVIAAARQTLSGLLELAALEAHRAAVAMMWMIALAAVAVVCIVAAWIGLLAALGMWMVSMGFPAISTTIAIASVNLGVAAGLMYMSIRMGQRLLFSATRRQIAGGLSVEPPST